MSEISKETIKRLGADVVDLIKEPLTDQHIYYKHNEENMLEGYAMIIGRADTPYHHGAYFFKFEFPANYPYSPPKVSYYTLERSFRWNPNLYTNKKVCVDILNTWHGNSWTSCQTIRSILMILHCLVLNEKPLINEPGLDETHFDFEKYNLCIEYKSLEVAVYKIMTKHLSVYYDWFDIFRVEFETYVKDNFSAILDKKNKLEEKIQKFQTKNNLNWDRTKTIIRTRVYSIVVNMNFDELDKLYEKLANELKIHFNELITFEDEDNESKIQKTSKPKQKKNVKSSQIKKKELVNKEKEELKEKVEIEIGQNDISNLDEEDKPTFNKTKKIKKKIKKPEQVYILEEN